MPPLRADGNTEILLALAAAERAMRDESSPIRHVILLTDGRPSRQVFYTDLVTRMADAGITLTTIGLGESINELLLKTLARLGRGRFLYAPGPRDIPKVFTRDTRRVLEARSDAAKAAPRIDDPAAHPPAKPPARKPAPRKPSPPARPPSPPAPEAAVPVAPVASRLARVRSHEALQGFEEGMLPVVGLPRPATLAPGAGLLLEREDKRPALGSPRGRRSRARVARMAAAPGQGVRSLLPPADETFAPVVRVAHEARGDVLYVALPDRGDSD